MEDAIDSGYEDNISQPDDDDPPARAPSPQPPALPDYSLEIQQLREQLDQAQGDARALLAEKSNLQEEMDQLLAVQLRKDQELEELRGNLEDRRRAFLEQSDEMSALLAENQRHMLLNGQLLDKVEQLDQAQDDTRQLLAERSENQAEMDRLVSAQLLKDQELEELWATLEAQRQTALEQSSEMLALQAENQRQLLLQSQLQAKVEELEEIIRQQSVDLLDLRRRNEEISCECDAAVTQTEPEEDDWKSRSRSLQEQLLVDLPVRTRRWRSIIDKLRTDLEMNKGRREQSQTRMREKQEKDNLALQLKESMDQLKNIMSRQQETSRVWQQKYGAMQERFITELFYTDERGRTIIEEEQQRSTKEPKDKKKKKKRERDTKEGKKRRREQRKKLREDAKEAEKEKEEREKEDDRTKVKQEVKSRGFFRWWSQTE